MIVFQNVAFIGNSLTDTSSGRVNYPTYLCPKLGAVHVRNYAASGAHWASSPYLSGMQWAENQVAALLADAAGAEFIPDILFSALWTNDNEHVYQTSPTIVRGSYPVARMKPIAGLDRTKSFEAKRYCLHLLRQSLPNIPIVGILPPQRPDVLRSLILPTMEDAARLYRDYNCLVSDASRCEIYGHREPGENIPATDIPHPIPAGSAIIADYVDADMRLQMFGLGT